MALPVIPNCYRVTWNFASYAGVTPRIVQHYLWASGDAEEFGETFWDTMNGGLWSPMHSNFEPQSLDIIKLDGVSATVNVPRAGFFLGDTCEGSGEISPASAAILKIGTNIRGPRGRGRSFVGPLCESTMSDGVLDDTWLDGMYGAWQTFLPNLSLLDPVIVLAVASYKHEEAQPVQSLSVEKVLGTQRRRQQQLR